MSLNNLKPMVQGTVESLRFVSARFLCTCGDFALRAADLLDIKKGGEAVVNITVDEIAPNGLGFGGGANIW